ncbi:hypothetical protein CN265_20375 [Priestia megaterium]|nr:hypothetical protein CN265_20375 [Priestia megaterium]
MEFFIGRFHVYGCFYLMIGGQDEDSSGESGTGETPQKRKLRGGSPAARGKRSLARNQKRCNKRLSSSLQFVRI